MNSVVSFETEPVSASEMQKRIVEYTSEYPWLVYETDGRILGYSYATKWKVRAAYKNSVESTVYVDKDFHSNGIGIALYQELLIQLQKKNLHVVVAGITLPNVKSERLHEKLGFKKIAHFEEIGRKNDAWLDVGYWQYKFSS